MVFGLGVPTVGAGDVAKGIFTGLQKGGTFVEKYPWLRRTVGFLGSSLAFNENRVWGPLEKRDKEKPKGILNFIRRYCLANGYILGLLGAVGMFCMNRLVKIEEGKQPGFLHALGNLGAMAVAIGTPVITLYSQIKKIPILWQCGIEGRDEATLESIGGTKIKARDNKTLKDAAINPIQRFNTGRDPKGNIVGKDEESDIYSVANEKEIRVGLIGPQGTGKTSASDIITGKIIMQEGDDKVVVCQMNCNEMKQAVVENLQKQGIMEDISSMSSTAQGVLALRNLKGTDMVNLYMKDVLRQAREAHKQGKRFIWQIDDLHMLREFASCKNQNGQTYYDEEIFFEIIPTFYSIWEQSKTKGGVELDILYTSNIDVAELFGVDPTDDSAIEKLKGGKFGPIYNRLVGDQKSVGIPQLYTQSKIAAAYLLKLKDTLQETDEQFFKGGMLDTLRGKSSVQDKELTLANYIYDNFFFGKSISEERRGMYAKRMEGRNLEKAINAIKARYLVENNLRKPDVKVDLDFLKERLEVMLDDLYGKVKK